jgi:hypothetical protein
LVGQTQAPATQLRPPPHAAPQLPQLFGSVCVSVQAPAHCCWPPVQGFATHWPATQLSVLEQVRPHAPQLPVLELSGTQLPPQSTCPLGHAHAPPAHDLPPLHTMPTQSAGTQLPIWQTDSGSHVCMPQVVLKQVPPAQALPIGHAEPQWPQFCESVSRWVHWPLHATSPVGQPHWPALHTRPVAHATLTQSRWTHEPW